MILKLVRKSMGQECRSPRAFIAVFVLLSLMASAQNLTDYSKPTSHFPNPFGPYLAHQVPPPNFGNTPRIETLLKDGKLTLSLSDAVALALENNLDLAIARFNLSIADRSE